MDLLLTTWASSLAEHDCFCPPFAVFQSSTHQEQLAFVFAFCFFISLLIFSGIGKFSISEIQIDSLHCHPVSTRWRLRTACWEAEDGQGPQLRRERNGGSQANEVGLSSGWKRWQEVSLEIRGLRPDPLWASRFRRGVRCKRVGGKGLRHGHSSLGS